MDECKGSETRERFLWQQHSDGEGIEGIRRGAGVSRWLRLRRMIWGLWKEAKKVVTGAGTLLAENTLSPRVPCEGRNGGVS